MNRYNRVTPARYNPRSMQEMMMLPAMKRQQHDQTLSQASQLGLFDNKAISKDQPFLEEKIGEYEGTINDYVERLNSEGINNSSTSELINLAKNRRKLEKDFLQPAQANYEAQKALQKQLMEQEGWGPDEAQRFATAQINSFEGTFGEDGEVRSFNGQMLPKYVNSEERVQSAVENVEADQVQTLMQKYNLPGVNDFYSFLASNKVDKRDKQKIINAVQADLSGDVEFMKSYRTQSEINGLNEFDSNGRLKFGSFNEDGQYQPASSIDLMLAGKASGAGYTKQSLSFDKVKDDLALHNAKQQIDEQAQPGRAWSYTPAEVRNIQEESFVNELTGILEGKFKSEYDTSNNDPTAIGSSSMFGTYSTGDAFSREKMTLENASPEARQRYETIFNKMKDSGLIDPSTNIESPEAIAQVADHMAQYKDVSYSDPLIRPNEITGDSLEGALEYTAENGRVAEQVRADAQAGLAKMWDKNGNLIDPNDIDWDEAQVDYLGVIGPNNHLSNFKDANPDEMIMPSWISIDGEKHYVSKVSSQKKTGEFEAARWIKDLTLEGGLNPGLVNKNTMTTPVGEMDIASSYDPKTNTYNLNLDAEGGKFDFTGEKVTPSQLQEIMYRIYNKERIDNYGRGR